MTILSFHLQRIAFLLIFAVYSGSAQSIITISTEPSPDQFVRENPRYFFHDSAAVATWTDYREGKPEIYAQRLDAGGNLLGENFKIFANETILIPRNNESVLFGHISEPPTFYNLGYTVAKAQRFIGAVPLGAPVELERWENPFDYVGCPALGAYFAAIPGGFLLCDVFFGYSRIRAFDSEFQLTHLVPYSFLPETEIENFAVTSSRDGGYCFFWYDIPWDLPEEAPLYAKIFNPNHEVIADSVFLGNFRRLCGLTDYGYRYSNMRAVTLQDTLYQLFFTTSDSLWYATCTRSGQVLQTPAFIVLPRLAPPTAERAVSRLEITNPLAGVLGVFVQQRFTWYDDEQVYHSVEQITRQSFDAGGRPVGEGLTRLAPVEISGHIRRVDGDYQMIYRADNDIFVGRFDSLLQVLDSVQVNEDSSGANQHSPGVFAAAEGKFLVNWFDEKGRKARLVDANGSLLGEEFAPPFSTAQFFSDGELLTTYRSREGNVYATGYRIYSADWQLRTETELGRGAHVNLSVQVLDEAHFAALLGDSTELRILKIHKSNGIVGDTLLSILDDISYDIRVRFDGEQTLWALWAPARSLFSNYRAVDTDLETFSPIYTDREMRVENQQQFLPERRYGYITFDRSDSSNTGQFLVIKTVGDSLAVQRTRISGEGAHTLQMEILNRNRFLIKWLREDQVFLQSFDRDGRALQNPLVLPQVPTRFRNSYLFALNEGNVMIPWSALAGPGRGSDIQGMIIPVAAIVGVTDPTPSPSGFALRQNYPNPFNPVTTIEYQLPQPGQVRLSVYNLLGQKIRTLVEERQSPGVYRAKWDGRNETGQRRVASGIYIYELRIDGRIIGRQKMVLLK